jgi:hypothetical protein
MGELLRTEAERQRDGDAQRCLMVMVPQMAPFSEWPFSDPDPHPIRVPMCLATSYQAQVCRSSALASVVANCVLWSTRRLTNLLAIPRDHLASVHPARQAPRG